MQQMGDRAGALDIVLKRMEQTTKGAEEQALTPFQTALKNLKDETGGVGDAVVYSFQHMGDGIVSMATEGINDLIGAVEKIPNTVESAASGIWDAAQQADDAARQLSGGLASTSKKALVQAAAARTLAAEYTTSTPVMQRNTSLQGLIAKAWNDGGAPAEHATNYVQAYTDALLSTPCFYAAQASIRLRSFFIIFPSFSYRTRFSRRRRSFS